MIPFSTNARQNFDSHNGKGHSMAGIFKYVWGLFFISLFVLAAFVPSSAAKQGNSNFDLGQVPDELDVKNHAVFPADRPAKKRKKVTYLSPPNQVSQPANEGDSQLIRSVHVPNAFSYEVVQQPENNPFYVSSSKNLVTEFGLAKDYNNIGLLAHNNLAGKSFKHLNLGQEIYIVHKGGHSDRYTVSAIYRFQALEPTNTESRFVDLDTNKILTATELFGRMYTGAPHLVLQTCINAEGKPSWGRLFVIAIPDAETD